jgi:hypothetical protein
LTPVIREMLSHADVANPKWSWVRPHAITSVLPRVRLGMVEDFEKIREIILAYRSASGQFSGVEIGNGQYPALHSRGDVPPLTNAATWRLNENEYLGVEATTEMLLQSQGGVIRLFPFASVLPTASFENLRARGGFMVSASCAAGVLTQAMIESLAGEECRIRWDDDALPVVEERVDGGAARNVAVERGERTISFPTNARSTYLVRRA